MSKAFIIAEIGINHDGDLQNAIDMVEAANDCGADAVKFQYYDAAKLLGKDSPYYEYANKCQFTKDQHEVVAAYASLIGIEWMCSVFDVADIPWADKWVKRHKVASRMNQNKEFLEALANTGKEVIMSVQKDGEQPYKNWKYMYCITKYPTPLKDLKHLPCGPMLGLSSHCPSLAPTFRAVQLGAPVIEHHICWDRAEDGCDKSSSITFEELKVLSDYAKRHTETLEGRRLGFHP